MKGLFHIFIFVFCVLFLTWIAGCKPGVPSGIISPDKMEKLLYDYHLADAMAQQADGGYNKNVFAFRAAVLEKYGVTQSEFDSSMVYYMRHTDDLHTIYQHITDRMQAENKNFGGDMLSASAGGDSVNIWNGASSFVLFPNQPYNYHSFSLKTDTTFHRGDHVVLTFNTDFIFQDGMRDGIAVLAVTYANDSVFQRFVHLSSSMETKLQIDDNDSLGYKSIKGYFMFSSNDMGIPSTTLRLIDISNIKLVRFRTKPAPPQAPMPSQIPVNKAVPDSERMRPPVTR